MAETSSKFCSSSSKGQKNSSNRLSNLHESLIQRILSFLDTKQAVQTSLLSKSWRYAWHSVSNLILDHSNWEGGPSYIIPFSNFIEKILYHMYNLGPKKLHLNCGFYCNKDRINLWICSAVVKFQIKEIYLEISSFQKSHTLPNCLFKSAITKLVLNFYEVCGDLEYYSWNQLPTPRDYMVRIPESMCSASKLQTLELISARLPEGNLESELVLRCPVLKNLVITNCDHHNLKLVNVCAPQLKTLDIRNDCVKLLGSCAIEISSPNLEILRLKGFLYRDYRVEKLSYLVCAEIVISGHIDEKGSQSLEHLNNILKGIYTVRNLHLYNPRFQHANSHQTLDRLCTEFSKLRCLKMTWSGNSCLQVITNILRSPHIETLVLEVIKACFDSKSFEDKSLFQNMFCHLKYIVIQKLYGTPNEFRILGCLLQNATVLEKLTIGLSELLSTNKKEAERICKLLTFIPRASSNVKIQFLGERDRVDTSN